MKKRFAPLILAVPLLLAGCGAAEPEPTPEEAFMSEAEAALAPPEGVEADAEMAEVSEGDAIHLDCYSHLPCDGDFTIETITMSDECVQRVDDYGMGPELEGGETYLQIDGVFELRTADNGWTMLNDPQIVNADGFTESTKRAMNCREDGEYQMWSNTLDVGQKAKHFGVWIVPEGATHALLEDVKITLPEVDNSPEVDLSDDGEPTPEAAPAEQPAAPVADEPTYNEDHLQGEGYYSSPDNPALAEHYAEQERLASIPFADGGTCPAYKCGYGTNGQGQQNPTSGEIQSLHGCQEGYITDSELCDAVAWVENHQY